MSSGPSRKPTVTQPRLPDNDFKDSTLTLMQLQQDTITNQAYDTQPGEEPPPVQHEGFINFSPQMRTETGKFLIVLALGLAAVSFYKASRSK